MLTNLLFKAMIEAGELEDSITDKIAKVLRFIELQQTPVEIPQSNPINKSTPMSLASADPQLLSSQVPPASIVSTQTPEISSDTPLITPLLAATLFLLLLVQLLHQQ